MLYFVNGLGGNGVRDFGTPVPGSEYRYGTNANSGTHGADGKNGARRVDTFELNQNNLPSAPPPLSTVNVVARGASWDFFDAVDTSSAANGSKPNKYPMDRHRRDWFKPDYDKSTVAFGKWKVNLAPCREGHFWYWRCWR